jgi:RNA polymerase primary sigma factor
MAKYIDFNNDKTIGQYFKDVRGTNKLTRGEEYELALRIQAGDEKAMHKLVKDNLKFVVSVAKEYQDCGLPLNDLINEGNYGLVKAAQKFDPERGFKFISYAVWWVRQSILHSLNEHSRMVRLPANLINKMNKLKRDLERFEQKYEREANFGEEVDDDGGKYDIELENVCLSLNDKSWDGEGDEWGDLISEDVNGDEDSGIYVVDDRIRDEMEQTLKILTNRERDIIKCYFGIDTGCEPMTLEGIGDRYGLTKERVRQIKSKAIRKLRHNAHGLFMAMSE